jgi:hypothetical protein
MSSDILPVPPVVTIEEFFAWRLPRSLKGNPGLAGDPGTLAIIVDGAGSWTVRFGNATEPVVDDADAESDCIAVWMRPAFEALLKGSREVDVVRPSAVVGDERLLVRLGAHLRPVHKGGVAARLQAF